MNMGAKVRMPPSRSFLSVRGLLAALGLAFLCCCGHPAREITYKEVRGASDCTQNCSGHEAGWRWASHHRISDPNSCGGNSGSFRQGCRAFVATGGAGYSTFWTVAVLYGVIAYLCGHQGSHLAAVRTGRAPLAPVLVTILIVYNWLFFVPWLFLIWFGYETVWWWALAVLAIGFACQAVLTKIAMSTGLQKNAWAISLIGIPAIPLLLLAMVAATVRQF